MADPLRRTILAKLRGKKSKKSTAVGGCGVSAIGDREGKDDVLQKRNERNQQEPPCSELSVIPATMWGNASGLNREFDNRDFALVRENTVVTDEVTQYGAFMDINSSPAIVQASENLTPRVRVNEELLGVSDQSQISTRVNVHNFNGQEPNFPRQVRPGFLERAHDQKKHTVPMPRKYSLGDSIGFGTCENYSSNSKHCADIGPVKLTDGGCPISKNKACKEDLKIPFSGTALGSTSESNRGFINAFVVRTDANIRADNINNNKKLFQFDSSDVYQVDSQEAEGHVLIQSIESYENTLEHLGVNKVNNVQSPAFFPTELEICDISRPDRCQGPREGTQRHNSLDSEDDDYYDNEILTLYEPESKNCDINEGESSSERSEFKNCGSALETDRLRTQLKEAYHLLINAMQDISFDSQVPVNGFSHRMSIPSHSQDSVCTQSSAKVVDSDPCSSGNNSPQQFSDTDSLILNSSKTQVQGFTGTLISKSCDSLITAKGRPTLQKSASDGNIDYGVSMSGSRSLASQISVVCHYGQPGRVAPKEKQPVRDGISSDDLPESGGDGPVNDSSGSVNSLTGSSDCAESQGSRVGFNSAQGVFAKPHGVTVNKMQEWMHRGCVLSSKMRQRITGPSPCGLGVSSHGLSDKTNPTTQMPSVPGSKSTIPFQGAQQSALTENVHSSITAAVDARPGRPADSLTPLNTITVSKKRNWLEQSSFKSYTGDEDVINGGLDDGLGHVAHHGCPSLDPCGVHVPMPTPGLCQSESQYQTCVDAGQAKDLPQCRPVDPTEENDADDEGEIWYNPIPEDEEPEPHSGGASEPPEPRRRACSRRLMGGSADHCLGGLGGEAGHMNATHSTEAAQLHRQMFAYKTVEERPAARAPATDATEVSTFSPPSSPSPTKKGGSINWSFPDKIKSPRTVRKLSMKMKKLPELSRKLSAKTPLGAAPPGPGPLSPKPSRSTEPGQGAPPPAHVPVARAGQAAASRNVISRYHLDSSVSTQHSYGNKKSGEGSKSASKGGYLSDGDSPELLAKSQKHSADAKPVKGKEGTGGGGGAKPHGAELDVDAFRHYSSAEQPKCSQYISGLMNLHFYGAEDLKPPRVDSRDVFCAIQVDCVNKARTALLTCRTAFLDMDHAFNIELENAQHLKLVVFSWEATPRRNRVCCHGTVLLPALFRVSRAHQLAVKLEPRGIIYVKLNLMERWHNSLDGPEGDHSPQVFGIDVWKLVEQENVGLMVPLIIEKCITEIENRGCQVVGLYRLCGSAAVKKELREAFEKDSRFVELSENQYPDVHVITGVLKDYLRELPYPLISKELYEAVLDSMAKRPLRIGASGNENSAADSEHTVTLLDILPDVEKATLRMLLDHLKLVASHHEVNKMTCQNLAVCFGPVLLSQRQEVSSHSNRVFVDSEELNSALHFKKHIEVLHYLLQLWPVADACCAVPAAVPEPSAGVTAAPQYLRRRRERPQVLNLSAMDMSGMLRPKAGRLDSPSNRYAGDWSGCGESYLLPGSGAGADEADYDDVASEDVDDSGDRRETPGQIIVATEERGGRSSEWEAGDAGSVHLCTELSTNHILETQEHTYQAYMKIQEISPVLRNRVNLKDLQESIDTLIGNLERELNKNKLHLSY